MPMFVPHLPLPLIIGLAVLVVIVMVAVALLQGKKREDLGEFSFSRATLLTLAEKSFLASLDAAAAGSVRVFTKVRLMDLILPTQGTVRRQTAINKIQSKHVDFVLCDKATLAVLGVVELDNRSHDELDRRDRDGFVDGALKSAGIPIVHVAAKAAYDIADLRQKLSQVSKVMSAQQKENTCKS
jgi:very-short-patch-repair endonuclease